MKLIDIIVVTVVVFVLFEGFESEFSNPTIFDFIKWFACIFMIISYLYHKRRSVK